MQGCSQGQLCIFFGNLEVKGIFFDGCYLLKIINFGLLNQLFEIYEEIPILCGDVLRTALRSDH